MIKLLKNKKGMSLLEIIISIMLFTIIASTVLAVLSTNLKAHSAATELSEVNTLLDNLSSILINDLSNATAVEVSGTTLTITTDVHTIVYDIIDGLLCRDSEPVLDGQYYRGKTIDVEYCDSDGDSIDSGTSNMFIIKFTLSNRNGVISSREYAVRPLGLNDYN